MNQHINENLGRSLEMLKDTPPLICPSCKSEHFVVRLAQVSNDRGQELYGNLFTVCANDKCGAVIGPYNPAPDLPV
jgi:hypothetical protein